jgi:DNA-binding GntR family transcriptional regulator
MQQSTAPRLDPSLDPVPGAGRGVRRSSSAEDWALTPDELARSRGARRELVRDRVARMVLGGVFATRERLGEERLADLLGVSRTPVREALARLHAERLLGRYDDGGYYVAEPDLAGLRDLYELRITLEIRGLTRSIEGFERHDPALLEPLRDHWRALQRDLPEPAPDFVEVDESFHSELSRASGNLALAETLETVNARIRPVRMHDFLTEDRIAATVAEHLGILEAVLAQDVELSARRMREHVGDSMAVVQHRAARALTRMTLQRRWPR